MRLLLLFYEIPGHEADPGASQETCSLSLQL